MAGSTVTFLVGFGPTASNQYFALWLDLNANGVFDMSEMMYSSSSPTSSPATLVGTITIPMNTISGRVAMRICTKRGGVVMASEACTMNAYGEYQDYTIGLNTQGVCSGVPTSPNTMVLCCPGTATQLFKLSMTQNAPNTYSWESSPDLITWTPIANTNHDYYSPAVITSTYICYRCLITCSISSLDAYSAPLCQPCNPLSVIQRKWNETMSIQPNPFTSGFELTLESSIRQSMNLVLLNSFGSKVKEIPVYINEGKNRFELDTDSLSPNIYFLQVCDENGYSKYFKLFKEGN